MLCCVFVIDEMISVNVILYVCGDLMMSVLCMLVVMSESVVLYFCDG